MTATSIKSSPTRDAAALDRAIDTLKAARIALESYEAAAGKSRETSLALTKVDEARLWLREAFEDRMFRS